MSPPQTVLQYTVTFYCLCAGPFFIYSVYWRVATNVKVHYHQMCWVLGAELLYKQCRVKLEYVVLRCSRFYINVFHKAKNTHAKCEAVKINVSTDIHSTYRQTFVELVRLWDCTSQQRRFLVWIPVWPGSFCVEFVGSTCASRFTGFHPQSRNMQLWFSGDSKLSGGVNMSSGIRSRNGWMGVWICESLLLQWCIHGMSL